MKFVKGAPAYVLSQSHHTDQGNSDYADAHPRLRPTRVSIPPYRSGQFGQDFQAFIDQGGRIGSQSHHTDQGNSDKLKSTSQAHLENVRVSIPPYRSGQFGQRRLQVLRAERVRTPFSVTSPIRAAGGCRWRSSEGPFSSQPLAAIGSWGGAVTSLPEWRFARGAILVRHGPCPALDVSFQRRGCFGEELYSRGSGGFNQTRLRFRRRSVPARRWRPCRRGGPRRCGAGVRRGRGRRRAPGCR